MSEIFRHNGKISIRVYPHDHEPIHVHVVVKTLEIEFKVFIENYSVEHVTIGQMSASDERLIISQIKKREQKIKEKWDEYQKDQTK